MNKFIRVPGEIRQASRTLLELVDEGVLDARAVLDAALGWLDDEDVEEMATANQFLEYPDEEEDE